MPNLAVKTKLDAEQIIADAIRTGASHVHIEPQADSVVVRYRRAGILQAGERLSKDVGPVIAKQFKRFAKLSLRQTQAPQVGFFETVVGHQRYHIEVATLPLLDGEKITVRLHIDKAPETNLVQLGLWGDTLITVGHALTQPHGLIVVAGRQQHYLRTTLLALIQQVQPHLERVAFINDTPIPVTDGIRHVGMYPEVGLGVSRRIKLLRRQGINVIGIYMLTGRLAAHAAVQAATEGLLVFSGVPGNNATDGLRFLKRASRLVGTIPTTRLAIGQVFVRRLCEACRGPYRPRKDELDQLITHFHINQSMVMKRVHALEQAAAAAGIGGSTPLGSSETTVHSLWRASDQGCQSCHMSGYSDEVGLFEATALSDVFRQQLTGSVLARNLREAAIAEGMVSLEVDGLVKALRGLIDLPTLLAVCR